MKKERIKFLLLTHGIWGESLIESLKMIIGKIENVAILSLFPETTFEEYYSRVEDIIKIMDKKGIIFTDIFGGTPTNIAIKLGSKYNIKVYSGLNAPLLLEALSEEEVNFEKVLAEGKNGIRDVVYEFKKSIEKK